MSKAFAKEDVEVPEPRAGRVRAASGLPPGAVNYMTAEGAQRLREEAARAKGDAAAELRRVLDSATVVPAAETSPEEVIFGATVIVREAGDGQQTAYRIVGVDEAGLSPGWLSWVSPMAKALLWGRVGQRVHLPETPPGDAVEITEILR